MDYLEIIQIINSVLVDDSSQHLYLLLDYSQLKKNQNSSLLSYGGIPIWRGVLKMKDETISPVLFELDRQDFVHQIKQICETIKDLPSYSIILSPLLPTKLAEHLGQYSVCQTQDNQLLILRFCDTRILPLLEKTFSDEHRTHFFAPIVNWFYPDIAGEWQLIESRYTGDVPKLKEVILELTDSEYEAILDASIPYILFSKIHEYLIQSGNMNRNIQSSLWKDIQFEIMKEDLSSPFFSIHGFVEEYLQLLPDKLEAWGSNG